MEQANSTVQSTTFQRQVWSYFLQQLQDDGQIGMCPTTKPWGILSMVDVWESCSNVDDENDKNLEDLDLNSCLGNVVSEWQRDHQETQVIHKELAKQSLSSPLEFLEGIVDQQLSIHGIPASKYTDLSVLERTVMWHNHLHPSPGEGRCFTLWLVTLRPYVNSVQKEMRKVQLPTSTSYGDFLACIRDLSSYSASVILNDQQGRIRCQNAVVVDKSTSRHPGHLLPNGWTYRLVDKDQKMPQKVTEQMITDEYAYKNMLKGLNRADVGGAVIFHKDMMEIWNEGEANGKELHRDWDDNNKNEPLDEEGQRYFKPVDWAALAERENEYLATMR